MHTLVTDPICGFAGENSQIHRQAQQQRCRFARNFAAKASIIMMIAFAGSLLRVGLMYGYFRDPGHSKEEIRKDLVGSEILPLAFAYAVFIHLNLKGPSLTPTLLDCANVVLSGAVVWRYFTMLPSWYEYHSIAIWALRIIQGICFGNARLTTSLNIAVTIADISAHTAHVQSMSVKRVLGYVTSQTGVLLLAASMWWSFEQLMQSEAEALLEARRTTRVSALVHRLLSAMCDAVVNLDKDLRITQPCPKLAGLLLYAGAGSSMMARRFTDLLPPAERERFTRYIAQEVRSQGMALENLMDDTPARALHLHLHDVHSTSVPVMVFSSFISDADGSNCHLVGIQVEEDISAPALRTRSIGEPSNTRGGGVDSVNMIGRIDETSCSEVGTDACTSHLSTGSSIEEIAFCFRLHDFTMNALPVSDYSIAFAALLGPSVERGFNMLEWLEYEDICTLCDFVLDEAMTFACQQTGELGASCRITFQPPHLRSSNLALHATVTLKITRIDEGVEGLTESRDLMEPTAWMRGLSVVATLRDVSWRHRRRARRGPTTHHRDGRGRGGVGRQSPRGDDSSSERVVGRATGSRTLVGTSAQGRISL